jgi:hypothetical protein
MMIITYHLDSPGINVEYFPLGFAVLDFFEPDLDFFEVDGFGVFAEEDIDGLLFLIVVDELLVEAHDGFEEAVEVAFAAAGDGGVG